MSKIDPTSPNDPPKEGRPDHLSVNRRGFFREILGLGIDQIDQAGKKIGRRLGDFVENNREIPQKLTPPKAEPPKRTPPSNTQARGK